MHFSARYGSNSQMPERHTVPPADLAKMRPILDALEAAFRPLAASIPHDTQPALIHTLDPEDNR